MNLSKTLNILIDADILCFTSAIVGCNKVDWGDGIVTEEYDLGKATAVLSYQVAHIIAKVREHFYRTEDYKVTMCLSHSKNFRKTLNPLYKSNRTAPKPKLLSDVRAFVESKYDCECWENLEADDVLCILGESLDNTCVCSIDKDLLTTRNTTVYNWKRETFEVTDPQTALWHHYYQTLKGDSVDGFGGAKGIGDKKARLALEAGVTWENIVSIYESKGQTEEEALLMARMAKLLTPELYDRHSGEVKLWVPHA